MVHLEEPWRERPRVMALVGRLEEAERAAQVAEQSGAEFAGSLVIGSGLVENLLEHPADAWLVSASDPALAAPLWVLLGTLNMRAGKSGVPVIARVIPELVDLAWARLDEPSTTVLCAPSRAEEVAALSMELAGCRSEPMVADTGGDRNARQLRKLSEDVDRIARVLASLSVDDTASPGSEAPAAAEVELPEPGDGAVRLIRSMVRARRLRASFFPADLFADPAWDMLLDLMAARLERKRVAVSSLCIAAAVPATTALRYLKTMTGAGLFVRRPDATDGRRVFIELSDAAAQEMTRYLDRMRGMMAPVFV